MVGFSVVAAYSGTGILVYDGQFSLVSGFLEAISSTDQGY
jgi:hypothetical protein